MTTNEEILSIISSLNGLKEINFGNSTIDIDYICNTIESILETDGGNNKCKEQ